jgi:hypothetical protein
MQLLAFREIRKGALIRYAGVRLSIDLAMDDVAVIVGKNGPFTAPLPTKAQIDRDGRQTRDVNGKSACAQILKLRDRTLADRLSEAVISLVREAHLDALAGKASP